MKFFPFVIFLAWSFSALQAEPAVKMEAFAGIPLGATAEQVKAAMDARAALLSAGKSTSGHLEFEGGTFNGDAAGSWHFYFFGNKLYKASVRIGASGIGQMEAYERYKKTISEKYGKPAQETTVVMEPEEISKLLRKGELELETKWRFEGDRNSVLCQFSRTPAGVMALRITYQDEAVEAQVVEEQKKDI